jgi:hypothetical protein
MSDFSQGEGWWQASDGKWYPAEAAPPGFAAPSAGDPTAPVPPVPPVPPTAPIAPPPVPPAQETQPFGTPVAGPPMGAPYGGPPVGGPPMGGPPLGGPLPGATPAKSGLGTGPIIAIAVAAVVVIGAIVFFATSGGSKKNVSATSSSSSSSTRSSSSSSTRSSSSSSTRSSSSSSSGAPNVVAPNGFNTFSDDIDQFALAVPGAFEVADLSSGDATAASAEAEAKNPAFSTFKDQIKKLIDNRGKMFAVDLSGDGFADNLSVIKAPNFDTTSQSGKDTLKTQIQSFGGSNVTFTSKTANGRQVTVAQYDLTINDANSNPVPAFGGQAYVSAGSNTWILTLTSSTDITSEFDTIVTSFAVNV